MLFVKNLSNALPGLGTEFVVCQDAAAVSGCELPDGGSEIAVEDSGIEGSKSIGFVFSAVGFSGLPAKASFKLQVFYQFANLIALPEVQSLREFVPDIARSCDAESFVEDQRREDGRSFGVVFAFDDSSDFSGIESDKSLAEFSLWKFVPSGANADNSAPLEN